MLTFEFMPNNSGKNPFEEDTENAIKLPRPTPENVDDGAGDEKKADSDSAFDDLVIDVDEDELEAEKEGNPSGRKY